MALKKGAVLIDTTLPPARSPRFPAKQSPLSPVKAILLAILCGLVGGYLDLGFIVSRKFFWNGLKNYANAHDFPWSVPVGHVVLLVIPAALLVAINWLRPRPISLRSASWLFATLAIWAALLRMPLYGVSSLLLAAGLGRVISGGIAAQFERPWQTPVHLLGAAGTAGLPGGVFIGPACTAGIPRVGQLAAAPFERPQRRADRVGRSPRRQT